VLAEMWFGTWRCCFSESAVSSDQVTSTELGRPDTDVGAGFSMTNPLAAHGKGRSPLKGQAGHWPGVTADSRLLSGLASTRTGEIPSPAWLEVPRERRLRFLRTGKACDEGVGGIQRYSQPSHGIARSLVRLRSQR